MCHCALGRHQFERNAGRRNASWRQIFGIRYTWEDAIRQPTLSSDGSSLIRYSAGNLTVPQPAASRFIRSSACHSSPLPTAPHLISKTRRGGDSARVLLCGVDRCCNLCRDLLLSRTQDNSSVKATVQWAFKRQLSSIIVLTEEEE